MPDQDIVLKRIGKGIRVYYKEEYIGTALITDVENLQRLVNEASNKSINQRLDTFRDEFIKSIDELVPEFERKLQLDIQSRCRAQRKRSWWPF